MAKTMRNRRPWRGANPLRYGCMATVRDNRWQVFPPVRRAIMAQIEAAAERAANLFLPGTKIVRPALGYWEDMVSVPMIIRQVEEGLYTAKAAPRYPRRPRRPRS